MFNKYSLKSGIIILIALVSFSNSFSQNPCAGKKYPVTYNRPSEGWAVAICESVPFPQTTTYNDNGTNKQVFINKWPQGSSIKFCNSDLSDGCYVDGTQLNSCIDKAYHDWASLCPASAINTERVDPGTGLNCCVRIQYSIAENDFKGASDISTTHAVANWVIDGNQGFIKCESVNRSLRTWIAINHTAKYLAGHLQAYPCPPPSSCNTQGRRLINLCRTLKHEIGHIFGLEHLDELWPDCGSNSQNDVMHSTGSGCDDLNLSTDDKCYFCALYCPNECNFYYAVHIPAENVECNIVPNPARNSISILFSDKSFMPENLTIFNALGQVVATIKVEPSSKNDQKINTILPQLPSGAYVFRIQDKKSFLCKRLLISK